MGTIKIHLSVCTKLDTAIRLDNMEKGIDDFHSVSIRLLSELCALQSCDRLCDDIINEFSRESAVLLQTSLSHQPGLLGAYLQHGIGAIGHNFPVATHPSRNSTLGQTLPYSSGGRYDAGESLFRTQFPPGNGQHLPVGGADITSVLNSSTHDIKALGKRSHVQLQGSMNGQMRVDKGVTQCMVYSCRNLSEPCKRKLKLCSEHKRAAQVRLHADAPLQRYCRYCHVLHDLDAFPQDDVRTICVRRNELRLKRSRERRHEMKLASSTGNHKTENEES